MMREECSKDKARLGHDHPEDFFICFWRKKPGIPLVWVVYRGVIVLYLITAGITIAALRDSEDSPWYKNPIFLDYWVYFLEMIAFVLAFAIGVERYLQEKKNPELLPMEKLPWHFKLFWVAYTTSLTSAGLITLVFCIFIYSKGVEYSYIKYAVITHISYTVIVIIDFSIAAIPCRLLHIYFPLLYIISYGVFSVIYQKSGGTGNQGKIPIYRILDWRYPLTALGTCTVHLVIAVIIHCGYYSLYLLKLYLKKKIEGRHEDRSL